MSTTGSAAPFNRTPEPIINVKVKRTHRKLITFLMSCCIFLAVLSGCLLTALVLIGKHYIHNNDGDSVISSTIVKDSEAPSNLTEFRIFQSINMRPPLTTKKPKNRDPIDKNSGLLRLPRDVVPSHYKIRLNPNLETGILKGKVNITVHVSSPRSEIILHAYKLNFTKVMITEVGDVAKRVQIKQLVVNEGAQVLIIELKSRIRPGDYYITLGYQVDISTKKIGLYKSTYRNKYGEKRAMATSKFEPTYARQAFPCFDEPNMKAKFQINLLKPANDDSYIALSNMPQVSSDEATSDGVLVRFQESVKMSTYLACFIVSDFGFTEDFIQINQTYSIPFRVYATPEQISKTAYARKIGKSVIEFYNEYFGIDFPLPKLDMAAIPDFVSGAMEHWGLVTYRETALLYSEEISATVNKVRVATVIAHELAHSWFGNLVTMNWWNDLWLNEGFATYIEYKGIEHAEKDWKMMDQFTIADMHPVLKLDSTVSSHPIVQSVVTPDQITSIFDTISYSKGASVLRMLEDAVTEDIFRQGVINYLKKHQYGNAVTQDLWDELQDLTDVADITEFMNTWTVQMGYPVVTVKEEGDNYILTQKRYLTDQNAIDNTVTPYNYTWIIPITYITNDSSTSTLFWFPSNLTQIEIKRPADAKWVKFNYKQVGYYRVIYEEAQWRTLMENVKDMETTEKAHLVEETFRLAGSGHINYDIPFELVSFLREEVEFVPWNTFSVVAGELKTFLLSSEHYTKYREYITNLVTPSYNYYNWSEDSEESDLTKRARVQILSLACSFGHSECLEIAAQKFVAWLESDDAVLSQDLRSNIYNYGMANSAPEYWDMLFQRFVNEADAGEKLRLLNGLANVKDTSYLTKLIELAKTDKYIRSQDYFTCLQYISANPIGTSIVWDYVREYWLELVDRFTLNDRYLGSLIPSITSTFATQTKLDEIKAFFAKYPDAGAGATSRLKAIETVENNIKWLANYKTQVESWLDTNVKI